MTFPLDMTCVHRLVWWQVRAEAMAKKRDRDLEKKKKEESELQMRRTIAEKEQEREKSIVEEESKVRSIDRQSSSSCSPKEPNGCSRLCV